MPAMKVIVATDFSPAAVSAAQSAVRLAKRLGDSMVLVRVIEPPALLYPELAVGGLDSIESALRANAEDQLRTTAHDLRAERVEIETCVLTGVPEQVLAGYARDANARLIAMGTHGRRAATRFFLGSVAERTVREAPCPVLVLREGAAPFDAWVAGSRPLRVMVAVDFSAASDAAVAWIGALRAMAPCDVILVHSYWPPREYTRLGLHGPRDVFETDPEVVAILERDLRARFGDLPGQGKLTLRIRAGWGRTADGLAFDADSEHVDVLVVGTHQPHGWERVRAGSIAIATLRSTHVPILCVPARVRAAVAPAAPKHPIPTLRTVLTATDFSDFGNAAIPHAYSLLRGTGGMVELCHVCERFLPSPIYTYDSEGDRLKPEIRRDLENRLRTLIPPDAESLGIDTHVVIIDGGIPAEALAQAAGRLGVDALCLASHGRSGLSKALLGSVTSALVQRVDKPVFIVRPPRE